MDSQARILCEDGTVFTGRAFGARGRASGRLIVSTAATGYENVILDATNAGAIAAFTTPHIGNTGLNLGEFGAVSIAVAGIIARDPVPRSSSTHATAELVSQMEADGVVGIRDVDTRALTRHARGRELNVTIESEM